MPQVSMLLMFALVALGMVLTPGPNMIYLISRSICQGRRAGLIAAFLAGRPVWMAVQRWLMGTVLAGLAVRMVVDSRR